MTDPIVRPTAHRKPAAERLLEQGLFSARWLMVAVVLDWPVIA